jgi:uncharacterized protein (DUF58 family)
MDITYVSTAEIVARRGGRTKRDTVAAQLRAFGCTEYRFGPKTIRWDAAEVAAYERSVVVERPSAQVTPSNSRPKRRGNTSGRRGAGGRRQRIEVDV